MLYDVAIIGAGVVGGLIARELSRYRLKIVMVERSHDVAMGTTKANSAIVHAGYDAECGSLKAKLNVEGSRMMESLCRKLGVKYLRNGSLVVAYRPQDMERIGKLYERGKKNGVEGLEILDTEKLHQMEPSLSQEAVGALFAPSGAIVCPYELNIAAVGNAMDNGAELLLDWEVTKITEDGDGYTHL